MKRLLLTVGNTISKFITMKYSVKSRNDSKEDDEEETEKQPMFYVGDRLHLFNPHTGELFYDFDSFGPTLYTVKDVDYDAEDETFRYLLDFDEGFDYIAIGVDGKEVEEIWVAEEWLSLPFYPEFSRTRIEVPVQEVTPEYIEVERKLTERILDEDLRNREIDRFLDIYRTGNVQQRKKAEIELRKLAGGGD